MTTLRKDWETGWYYLAKYYDFLHDITVGRSAEVCGCGCGHACVGMCVCGGGGIVSGGRVAWGVCGAAKLPLHLVDGAPLIVPCVQL